MIDSTLNEKCLIYKFKQLKNKAEIIK